MLHAHTIAEAMMIFLIRLDESAIKETDMDVHALLLTVMIAGVREVRRADIAEAVVTSNDQKIRCSA